MVADCKTEGELDLQVGVEVAVWAISDAQLGVVIPMEPAHHGA